MHRLLPLVLVLAIVSSGCGSEESSRILIFSKTAGFRHASIEVGAATLTRLAQERGFGAVHTEDAAIFSEDSLKTFSAVVFLNTTGDVLDAVQQADFERFVQAGGGYLGVHSASDTEYDWPWYGGLVGAYFVSHPAIQQATIDVLDNGHPATSHLGSSWVRTDEWYNFDRVPVGVTTLATLDESSYEGGSMNGHHPVTWYHEYDGGRAFYTAMGHTEESYSEAEYVTMLGGALDWAVAGGRKDYTRVRSDRVPIENRFTREILAAGLDEPMELEILDENRIAFVERKGRLRLYDRASASLRTIAELDVYTGQEDGLLGIAKDPRFDENGWIYLFYSPPGDEPKQQVSRFTMTGNSLDLSSEVVILVINNQRDECCHSGGSLEFDADGNLYISVGDDTNPFASDGYSPSDERTGRAPWDAQRTSANANDLRGKILRIRPLAEGSYEIPAGNLFPPGTEGTRPEIYAMGLRNPYRISIDSRTGFLYWGDVGPDASVDSSSRGPRGYDHINQARHPGFWGWPYSRGDRYAYNDYDFATGKSGDKHDLDAPVNDSPNNTGNRRLPKVERPFVWYPYGESDEFPWTGTGGRTAMAGPIYYHDAVRRSDDSFPEYFDGKLLAYEWMRDWIYVVTMDADGDYLKAEPFLPNAVFDNPTDMAFGADGSLYILEYGETWFSANADARLNRISYADGNRAPVASLSVDKAAGAVPLKVVASAAATADPDGDRLVYQWTLDGSPLAGNSDTAQFELTMPGDHEVAVTATDPGGKTARATVVLLAGNERPTVQIELTGNRQFFWPSRRLQWNITVDDAEDGMLGDGIEPATVEASLLIEPHSRGGSASEEQAYAGAEMIGRSDCGACHALDSRINGPAYREIAGRYTVTDVPYLTTKIINGGSGVWGERVMAGHPQLSPKDVQTMVEYILATGRAASEQPIKPAGVQTLAADVASATRVVIQARYSDRGKSPARSLDGSDRIALLPTRMEAEAASLKSEEVTAFVVEESTLLGSLTNGRYFAFRAIDLEEITAIEIGLHLSSGYAYAGAIEIHVDANDGPLLGSTAIRHERSVDSRMTRRMPLDATKLGARKTRDLYFVFRSAAPDQYVANVDWVAVVP